MTSPTSDIQKLAPGTLVELFTLDATTIGGEVFHFHAGTNGLGGDVVWQGIPYTRFPIQASGFEKRASGTAPRPKISGSNLDGMLWLAIKDHDDLVGAKVTRKRTFVRYLDAVNFAGGNPNADPNVEFSQDIFLIDRKSLENSTVVEWELVAATDLANVKLPRRQVIANICPWAYRGEECNYTGGPVATAADIATSNPALDVCGKKRSSCKLRFGANGVLRFGGFPAAGLIKG